MVLEVRFELTRLTRRLTRPLQSTTMGLQLMAGRVGLEPTTSTLTVLRSTDWTNGPYNSTYFAFYLFTALLTAMLHTAKASGVV